MRLIILFIILHISLSCYTQDGYFIKYENGPIDNESATLLIKLNEEKLVIASTADPDDNDPGWHLQVRVIDIETGTVDTIFNYSPYPGFRVIPEEYIFNQKGNLVFACRSRDNNLPGLIQGLFMLVEIDFDEGVIWSEIYGGNQFLNWKVTDIAQLDDGGYVMAGYGDHPETFRAQAILLKASATGDSLWVHKIHDQDYDVRAFTVEKGENNTCYFQFGSGDPAAQGKIKLEHIDGNDGSIIWDKNIPLDSPLFFKSLTNARGNIVLGGNRNINNKITPHYAEIDPLGNLVWAKSYEQALGFYHAEQFVETNDGGYAMCVRGSPYPVLFVVDRNGKYLFEKTYEIENYMSPTDLFQLEDGSFMIMGYEGATQEFSVWLIKTSPEGDLVSISGIESNQDLITVYPNPTSSIVRVKTSFVGKMKANLVDMKGAILQTKSSDSSDLDFDIAVMPNGIYYVNIFKDQVFFASKKVVKQ